MPSVSIPAALSAAMAAVGTAATATTAAVGTGIAGASSLATASLPAIAGISTASVPLAAATSVPTWLAYAGTASSVLGGVTGAYGAIKSGEAQAASARYNAAVEARNADMAKQNAAIAGQSGAQQAAIQSQKTRGELGAIKTNQAASGIDVNSGSALDVQVSATELGQLDALTLRSNAVKEAYGYATQATNYEAQSKLDLYEADNDAMAGYLNAGTTLLNSAGDAATNYQKYKMAGALNG